MSANGYHLHCYALVSLLLSLPIVLSAFATAIKHTVHASMHTTAILYAIVCIALLSQACSPEGMGTKPYRIPTEKLSQPTRNQQNIAYHSPVLAELPAGIVGPYAAFSKQNAIAVFSTNHAETGNSWFSLALDAQGRAAGKAHFIASSSPHVAFAVVRETNTVINDVVNYGFVVLWVDRQGGADTIYTAQLRDDGSTVGESQTLVQTREQVVWADIFSVKQHRYVLWAERSVASRCVPSPARNTARSEAPGSVTRPADSETVSSGTPHYDNSAPDNTRHRIKTDCNPSTSRNFTDFTANQFAQLYRQKLNSYGIADGPPIPVAQNVLGWNAIATQDALFVAVVSPNSPNDRKPKNRANNASHSSAVISRSIDASDQLGHVTLLRLDANSAAPATEIRLSSRPCARADVAVTQTTSRLLLAWTEACGNDVAVATVSTDLQGLVQGSTQKPLPPIGDHALVSLVAPCAQAPDQAVLVYEHATAQARRTPSSVTPREYWIVPLRNDATVGNFGLRAVIDPISEMPWEMISGNDGFVFLTRHIPSPQSQISTPWYVKLAPDLSVRTAQPIALGIDSDTAEAWDSLHVFAPGCTSAHCFAMGTLHGKTLHEQTTKLVANALSEGPIKPGLSLKPIVAPTAPMTTSLHTVLTPSHQLSSICAARDRDITFTGYLTYYSDLSAKNPSLRAHGKTRGAVAAVALLSNTPGRDDKQTRITILSDQAVSAGGMAIASEFSAAGSSANSAAITWITRVGSITSLQVVNISNDGKIKQKRTIIKQEADLSDVAMVAIPTGWVIAWVDWRDGNGEVYATRVNQNLITQGKEKRLTRAAGSASDIALLAVGNRIAIAYGSTRDHPKFERANPFIQMIDAQSLEITHKERRVDSSTVHTTGIELSRWGQDVVMGWQQQPMPSMDRDKQASVRVIRLDRDSLAGRGRIVDILNIHKAADAPITWSMACDVDGCNAVVLQPVAERFMWHGVRFVPDTFTIKRGILAYTSTRQAVDVAPVLLQDTIYFVDPNVEGMQRIRRANVQWTAIVGQPTHKSSNNLFDNVVHLR